MYFWRIHRLTASLRDGPVSTRDRWGYAFGIAVVWLGGYLTRGAGSPPTSLDLVLKIGMTLLTAGALLLAYRLNGTDDFIGRILALWWVVGNRVFVGFLAVLLIGGFVLGAIGRIPSDPALDRATWIMMFVMNGLFLWRVLHHLRAVVAPEPAP